MWDLHVRSPLFQPFIHEAGRKSPSLKDRVWGCVAGPAHRTIGAQDHCWSSETGFYFSGRVSLYADLPLLGWNIPQQVWGCSVRLGCAVPATRVIPPHTAFCFPVTLPCLSPGFPFFFFFPPSSFIIFFPRPTDLFLGSAALVLHINSPVWKYQTEPSSLSTSEEEGAVFLCFLYALFLLCVKYDLLTGQEAI